MWSRPPTPYSLTPYFPLSQLLRIELGVDLAPQRLLQLRRVAADVLGELLPLLDIAGMGVEDRLRVGDAEALGHLDVALALAGLVLGHQLVEVLADGHLLH